MDFQSKKWMSLSKLCWGGFDKVMKYASKHYPNESTNKSLELFMVQYDGNWNDKINEIIHEE